LNPALPRLIALPPGGRERVRDGMVSLVTETHFFKRLAIQFSETDSRRWGADCSAPSRPGPVGVCRRGMLLIRAEGFRVNRDRIFFHSPCRLPSKYSIRNEFSTENRSRLLRIGSKNVRTRHLPCAAPVASLELVRASGLTRCQVRRFRLS